VTLATVSHGIHLSGNWWCITATNRGDANWYKKVGWSNTVPFLINYPDIYAEPNADSEGVLPVDEEADK
jgi:hypothetical protein